MRSKDEARRDAGLQELLRGLDWWRRRRRRRERIPERLWAAAVQAARRLGLSAVSRAAGLSYYSLKARLGGVDVGGASVTAPRFIELMVPGLAAAPESVAAASEPDLELERPDGVRLTIRHARASDLTCVVSAFLGGGSCSS